MVGSFVTYDDFDDGMARSSLRESISFAGGQFVNTICKGKGAHGHSLWDINSGSLTLSPTAAKGNLGNPNLMQGLKVLNQ